MMACGSTGSVIMTDEFQCDYDDCENSPTLVRELVESGVKYQFCGEHDPLEDDSASFAFQKQ